jgi:hypothetical protein
LRPPVRPGSEGVPRQFYRFDLRPLRKSASLQLTTKNAPSTVIALFSVF